MSRAYCRRHWRIDADYNYFNQLTPEQAAFKFLRRNPDYNAACLKLPDGSGGGSAPFAARWGLRLRGRSAAAQRPGASHLAAPAQSPDDGADGVQPDLFDGPQLSNARPTIAHNAPEGRYADLTARAPPHQALMSNRFQFRPHFAPNRDPVGVRNQALNSLRFCSEGAVGKWPAGATVKSLA